MLLKAGQSGKIMTWTICDPRHRNALGPKLFVELDEALKGLEGVLSNSSDSNIDEPAPARVLVIRAEPCGRPGHEICIAGGNLAELSLLSSKREGHEYALNYAWFCRRLMSLPIPVIVVIDGLLIGGGIELALSGDIRIASTRSHFHFKQLGMGLSAGFASTARLSSLVGLSRSTEYMMLERKITSTEALRGGLVGAVVAEFDLDHQLSEMTRVILSKDFASLAVQKEMLNRQFLENDCQIEQDLRKFRGLWMEEFHAKSLKEFTNKG